MCAVRVPAFVGFTAGAGACGGKERGKTRKGTPTCGRDVNLFPQGHLVAGQYYCSRCNELVFLVQANGNVIETVGGDRAIVHFLVDCAA